MADIFMTTAKNSMLTHAGSLIDGVSLHSADPGTTGTSELTGGSPAYARKTPTWDTAASGELPLASDIEFDVPAASTVAWVGFWDSTTFMGKAQLSASESYASQGTYTLTTSTKLTITDPA